MSAMDSQTAAAAAATVTAADDERRTDDQHLGDNDVIARLPDGHTCNDNGEPHTFALCFNT